MSRLALLLLWGCALPLCLGALNMRPIIGILSLPNSDGTPRGGPSHIGAAYVKWIEQAGARVAVIPWDAEPSELSNLFSSINGLLFTGGSLSFTENTTLYQTASYLYGVAVNANSNGDYFPVWGTCQGFELLCVIAARNQSVLGYNVYQSENLPLPLVFTEEASTSRLWGKAPSSVLSILATQPVTQNLHVNGITPDDFSNNQNLSSVFRILSTNVDLNNRPFVSSMEGIEYPFYATQWHPERVQFEWDLPEHLDHSLDAVTAVQYVANFFVNECRKNTHSFPSPTVEEVHLIYQYPIKYTGNITDNFPPQQTYYFQTKP
eukprot:TRINITY_DN900_c0_g2_i2.p1 TRINITY_DN900_c0_g2~~TRINITY_DN900_c0_g2_i2.p1  ORF type:complete len:320 (-),score=47.30 TRINITY_DN900_c0_g2_i2:698-1657(-)